MPDIEPKNREEIFLKNITRTLGGDDPVEIEPHNRQEHFLKNIAVALGADGVATDIEPNKRIEYLYKNIESIASASRNRVQVIESTMANPLGDLDPEELIPKLTNPFEDKIPSGATGFLSIDATALGFFRDAFGFIYASGSTGVQTTGADMASDSATCFSADWSYGEITPTVNWIFIGQIPGDGTGAVMDVSAYAENLPTKLTIVWHDLNGGAGIGSTLGL